jgi:hypothetical protein
MQHGGSPIMPLTLTDKLDILICMRLETPTPQTLNVRQEIAAAILKENPELIPAMEQIEKALQVY